MNGLEKIDYGMGERELMCTAWTMVVYEQEFRDKDGNPADLIADTMGKIIVTSEDLLTVNEDGAFVTLVEDYTRFDWNATLKALWALLKTAYDVAISEGRRIEAVPSWDEWSRSLLTCEPDMQEVRTVVVRELQRGLFRAGAAASGKTSEE